MPYQSCNRTSRSRMSAPVAPRITQIGAKCRSMKIRESKRKKLAAKGRTIGSAKEFLVLSSEEAAYIELRLKLTEGPKMRPHSRGVAQTQLAQTLHSSQSKRPAHHGPLLSQ